MRLHKEVDAASRCGGQVADGNMFGEDYWCVYCGAKWSADSESDFLAEHVEVIAVPIPAPRRTVAIAGRCTMPTASARMCRRMAEVQYLRADGTQVAAYCTQHDSAKSGRCWVLRPAPWDYSERRIVADYFPGTDVQRGPFGPSDSRRKSLFVSEGN